MDTIVVLDFGGQYTHLISRRIRDLNVFSHVMPAETSVEEVKSIKGLKGVIFSGGAASVYDKDSPKCDKAMLDVGVPVLGICYGHQLISLLEKGKVTYGMKGEYGITDLEITKEGSLLKEAGRTLKVWMNHRDIVEHLPEGYETVAATRNSPVAAFENPLKHVYGVQFHPEVTHTQNGMKILENFASGICKARKEWTSGLFVEKAVREARATIGNKKAVIGLSGGVDSSVSAVLMSKAIGRNLTAVYVDTGMMRHRETEFIKKTFSKYDLDLRIVDASDRFFKALKGVTDPEKKRKIIGKTFIEIFDKVADDVGAEYLVQGTIYSDRIESGHSKHSSRIKSHHNVGGLPEDMKMRVYEPLRDIYKDEVRKVAEELDMPMDIIKRHVFPGPGLGVRIVGEVTPEKAEIVRKASYIIETELEEAGLHEKAWMAFAILLSVKSVGVQGDERSYKYPVVVRIIESEDAMTANFTKVPYKLLEKISTRITNEIKEVNRVVYDITNKPPATMEWE
ncbi:MAG: glutamine-hydrolyzing GMP synthase [Candidatus Aenigmatarchaeota archaeon]|nr:MAG: glutamine-hydrolyzing GMP synthase [Candidatus Aenigmarchaeota archaeon]